MSTIVGQVILALWSDLVGSFAFNYRPPTTANFVRCTGKNNHQFNERMVAISKGSCSWHPNSSLRAGFASVNFRVAIILRGAEGLTISAFIQATELILLPEIHLAFIAPRLLSDDHFCAC
jgi:hypothetical protein